MITPLVELVATIPSNIKFKDGTMKNVLKNTMNTYLPPSILNRTDKMGFPVPLHEWMKKDARDFFNDVFSTSRAVNRDLIDNRKVLKKMNSESKYGRTIWGLLCLELWYQEFIDRAYAYRRLSREFHTTRLKTLTRSEQNENFDFWRSGIYRISPG